VAPEGGVMKAQFFIFSEVESSDAFFVSDGNGVPTPYETESDAIAAAKEYSATSLILRSVAQVTERTTYKVEKIK
jgi:hypothetical protein